MPVNVKARIRQLKKLEKNLRNLRAKARKAQIVANRAEAKLAKALGGSTIKPARRKRRRMSKAARNKIARAQKKRWAKYRKSKS